MPTGVENIENLNFTILLPRVPKMKNVQKITQLSFYKILKNKW